MPRILSGVLPSLKPLSGMPPGPETRPRPLVPSGELGSHRKMSPRKAELSIAFGAVFCPQPPVWVSQGLRAPAGVTSLPSMLRQEQHSRVGRASEQRKHHRTG